MKNWFNRNATHLAIIGIFIAICLIYFSPAWQGKVLIQSDVTQAQAMQKEIMDFKQEDGKGPLWTNSMFSGMPSYQIWVSYPKNIGTHIMAGLKGALPYPMDVVLLYLLGAYLLFNVLRVKPWLAAVGAVAFAFTSYNFIYIEAGHANKAYAIALFAPVLAGILLTLRRKYLLGAGILALSLALEIRVNHIQVTYYLFIALLILIGIELYHAIKEKKVQDFIKAIAYMAVASIIALAVNAGLLWTTYEYSKESIRGKSNIASETKGSEQQGVSKEYAYQWSQGVGESITFLIPDAYGGGTYNKLDGNSNTAKVFSNKGYSIDQVPSNLFQMYWGGKPFTSGPWYFGAVVIFLLVLGLFVVKNRLKWWILSATLLSVMLSWGKNFTFISNIFFDYFPLYNKFRAVESTLVVASFLIPILAILAIDEIIKNGKTIEKLDKKIIYSTAIVGGISFIVWALPDLFFNFQAPNHSEWVQYLSQQLQDNSFGQALGNALVQDRIGLARGDAFRSLIFVLLTAGVVWLLAKNKMKATTATIVLGVLVIVDLWGVDRRYLNKDSFVEKSQAEQIFFKPREVDNLILMDKEKDYRVLDLTVDPFANANPSYFHKNIGGYHAAKLMRYNELIERQFSKSINEDVLDMLNTRYLITNNKEGTSQSIRRRDRAAGNAWFVDKVTYVKSNEEEMNAIDSFDPKKEAFIHQEFKSKIDEKRLGRPGNSSIELTSYKPDHLIYEYSAPNDVMGVFSEVWYDKGWKAFVDGNEIPILRANYVLRAAQLPRGNHKVEFKFEPQSYYMGENISLIASIILVLALGFAIWRERKTATPVG
ncbi:YfhO family protein [Olivibacter domesticus]|uniref:Membrane protein YfhO n=1 Tax=Olivibacter domesticus TaxID=407022 RepID=A0A1H7VIK5_OLID1|nr:YfhO family protein [Olivibacter domesticus]SEM08647.1 membrane protein YfhO [Olivibacter domesticus]